MKQYCVALSLFAALLGHSAQAQIAAFLDQVSQAPVADVTLTCPATGRTVLSKADGTADLAPLQDCDSIHITHLSFRPLTLSWSALATAGRVELAYRVNPLDAVVTSGSRFSEQRRDVPEQIDVLSRREIAFMAQPTGAELLQNTGTVFVQKSQLGGGSPTIRGFQANRVLLVVDGLRLHTKALHGVYTVVVTLSGTRHTARIIIK